MNGTPAPSPAPSLSPLCVLARICMCGLPGRPAGDARNAAGVLEWLLDDENRELVGEIEEINARMLERLLDESPFVAVFFCKSRREGRARSYTDRV